MSDKDAEIAREELRAILTRDNVIQHWPDDEAAAYRDNGGWSEGIEAVENIRIDKIIALVARQSPASTTAADAWDEGKAAERKFQNRPRGDWYMVCNPYRVAAPEGDGGK